FVRLVGLQRLPDIGTAVATGSFPIGEVWKLRQSREAVKFRAWLRNIHIHTPDDIISEYMTAIGREPRSSTWPARTIRLAGSSAIGVANALLGLVASGVDTFFVDKALNGYSPKLFFDQVERLALPGRVPPADPRVEELDAP